MVATELFLGGHGNCRYIVTGQYVEVFDMTRDQGYKYRNRCKRTAYVEGLVENLWKKEDVGHARVG